MNDPESWRLLLDRRAELEEQVANNEAMERMLYQQIEKIRSARQSRIARIADLEQSLHQLGWTPDRELA